MSLKGTGSGNYESPCSCGIKHLFNGEHCVYRRRLPVPMPAKNDISIWSILKQCVGKVSSSNNFITLSSIEGFELHRYTLSPLSRLLTGQVPCLETGGHWQCNKCWIWGKTCGILILYHRLSVGKVILAVSQRSTLFLFVGTGRYLYTRSLSLFV